jgi:hypothetical protein
LDAPTLEDKNQIAMALSQTRITSQKQARPSIWQARFSISISFLVLVLLRGWTMSDVFGDVGGCGGAACCVPALLLPLVGRGGGEPPFICGAQVGVFYNKSGFFYSPCYETPKNAIKKSRGKNVNTNKKYK